MLSVSIQPHAAFKQAKITQWSIESSKAAVPQFGQSKKYTKKVQNSEIDLRIEIDKTQKEGKKLYHRLRIYPMPNFMKTLMSLGEHL